MAIKLLVLKYGRYDVLLFPQDGDAGTGNILRWLVINTEVAHATSETSFSTDR